MFFYWARVAGVTIASLYLAVFIWNLRRKGTDYFLDRRGKFRLVSVALGVLLGVTLALRPPLAPLVFLVWVINGAVWSWSDYLRERRELRRRR